MTEDISIPKESYYGEDLDDRHAYFVSLLQEHITINGLVEKYANNQPIPYKSIRVKQSEFSQRLKEYLEKNHEKNVAARQIGSWTEHLGFTIENKTKIRPGGTTFLLFTKAMVAKVMAEGNPSQIDK
ncbi:MAG: hypothetical protein ACYCQJ_05200 [Nitrososphaerales archaeon]